MRTDFRTVLFGYSKKQVNETIDKLNREHEDAMALKNERFMEIRDKYNIMNVELAGLKSKEQVISSVLIKARSIADEMILEGERSAVSEKERLMEEIRQLDRLTQALYQRLENTATQAQDCLRSFEQELNELIMRKETFLKATYGFEKDEAGDVWKIRV